MSADCPRCGCPLTLRDSGEHNIEECRLSLRIRLEEVKKRADVLRTPIKNQSGVAESGAWLKATGGATYSARTRGASLGDRRTRPISKDYFERIVEMGQCLGCNGELQFKRNPRGGNYHACKRGGHECYYLGMQRDGFGYELLVAGAAAARKAG